MPSLIANHREKQTVAQLKKVYSTLQQALLLAEAKHGEAKYWGEIVRTDTGQMDENGEQILDYTTTTNVLNYLAENMQTLEGGKINENIIYEYDIYNLNGTLESKMTKSNKSPNMILTDGTQILGGWSSVTNGQTDIAVNLNKCAQKGKCTWGKDVFYFKLNFSPAKIVPEGSPTDIQGANAFKKYCNKSAANDSGRYCAAWVLQNENMDYLHCDDLDWNSKTRCK